MTREWLSFDEALLVLVAGVLVAVMVVSWVA